MCVEGEKGTEKKRRQTSAIVAPHRKQRSATVKGASHANAILEEIINGFREVLRRRVWKWTNDKKEESRLGGCGRQRR